MFSPTHHHPPGSIPPPLHHLPVRRYRIPEELRHLLRHHDRSPSRGLLHLALRHQHLPLYLGHRQKRLMLQKRLVKWKWQFRRFIEDERAWMASWNWRAGTCKIRSETHIFLKKSENKLQYPPFIKQMQAELV